MTFKVANCDHKKILAERIFPQEDEEKKLTTRQRNFISETESHQAIRLTMITSYGLKHNIHSSEVAEELTMDDRFTD